MKLKAPFACLLLALLPAVAFAQAPAAATAPVPATVVTEPRDAELLPPKAETHGEARIEQIRRGNRIVEVIVTPAGQTYSYTMQNREGRMQVTPPTTPVGLPGLSLPSFFKLEF